MKPALGAISAIVILFCLYQIFFSTPSVDLPEYDYVCSDKNCAHTENREMVTGQPFPIDCPKCSQSTFYPALQCGDCQKVTPEMPAKRNFACQSCDYVGEHRLDPDQIPHTCPECKKQKLFQLYLCRDCDYEFPGDYRNESQLEPGGIGGPLGTLKCPDCGEFTGRAADPDPTGSCIYCDSENLMRYNSKQ